MDTLLSKIPLLNKAGQYKDILIFLLKTIILYYGIKYCFYGYVGMTMPGGNFSYQPFYEDYNLVKWLTQGYVFVLQIVMSALGFVTYVPEWSTIMIKGASGIRVMFPCLGIELWIAAAALLFAYPIKVKRSFLAKSAAALSAFFAIFLLNNVRLLAIILTNHYQRSMMQTIHDWFNYLVYVLIFIGFYYWIKKFGEEGKNK